MTYYTGSVTAVPATGKQAFIDHATRAWPIFQKRGAVRMVEAWGEDVRDGEKTDFKKAVAAKPDETVVFSWIEWPDKATADAAWQSMMSDPDFAAQMGEMPFDGKRMIFGGFSPGFASGTDKGAGWIQGFVTSVPTANKTAYFDMAKDAFDTMFAPAGCIGSFENWGEDVPHGQQTDFYRAVAAEDGETVALSWTAWPDRATCDAAEKQMSEAMESEPPPEDMPFDMTRMIWSGFAPIFDSARA